MPAPPMPFVPEEDHGQLVILGMLVVRRRRPRPGSARSRRSARSATPLADMVRPMPYPEIYPPEDEGYHPIAVARTMFIDNVDGDAAATIVERLEPSDAHDARGAAAGARRRDGPRAGGRDGVRAPRAAGSWSTSPRSTTDPTTGSPARRGSTASRRRSARATTAPTSTSCATGAGPGPPGLPEGDLGSAGRDQAPLRPGQPVPAQPEHRAALIGRSRAPGRRARRRTAGFVRPPRRRAPRDLRGAASSDWCGAVRRAVRSGSEGLGRLRDPDGHPARPGPAGARTPRPRWCGRAHGPTDDEQVATGRAPARL